MLVGQPLDDRVKVLDAFFNCSISPVIFLDREFNFLRVNEAYARACQRDISEFAGKNLFALYPSDAKSIFEEVVRSKVASQIWAYPFTFPDHPEWGVTYWDWTLVPVLNAAGEVEYLVFSMIDVTVRKRNEDMSYALNEALKHRTLQLRMLAEELTQAEERERRRVAQSLHDNLQQLLVGAKFTLDLLQPRASGSEIGDSLKSASDMLDQAIDACGALVMDLSPPILYDVGLGAALEWLGREMKTRYGLDVETDIDWGAEPKAKNISILLFQSVRELMVNVMKHARARTVHVRMARTPEEGIRIDVVDDGIGFDPSLFPSSAGRPGGFGLFSIRERLDLLGGHLLVDSAPGQGSCMTLIAPLESACRLEPR